MEGERKKVQLSGKSRNVDTELKPTVVDLPGFKGTIPFPVARSLSKHREGPVELKAEEKRIADAPIITPEHIKKKAMTKLPDVVDFDDLSVEKQEEVKEALRAVNNRPTPSKTKPVVDTTQFVPTHPSVASAMRLAEKATREAEEKAANPPPPTEDNEQEQVVDSGAADPNAKCTHCGWPVGKSDPINPTTADKQNFVIAMLGQRRFTKRVDLLGGKLSVTFRTLTVKENDEVIKQLVKDWNEGKISGPAHSVAEATKYQMVLGLDSISREVGDVSLPEYADYEGMPQEGGTLLPDVVEYVYDNALNAEPLRRVVAKAYGHFMETVTKLEAMAESSDFW